MKHALRRDLFRDLAPATHLFLTDHFHIFEKHMPEIGDLKQSWLAQAVKQ